VALLLDGATFPLGFNLSTDINLMGRPLLDKLAGSANGHNWGKGKSAHKTDQQRETNVSSRL
jgi:hypothetical protein